MEHVVDPGFEIYEDEQPDPVVEAGGGALSDRMAQRAEQLERQQTEWFPIPGWEDMLEVELRALGYKTIRAVIRRNERVRDPDLSELYSLADQIAKATVGFREIRGETARPIGDDWLSLARRLPNAPDELNARKAILFLVGEQRIAFLVEEWAEWARSVRRDVDEEVGADFERTG